MIDTEAVCDGGIQLVEGDGILDHLPGVFVSLSVCHPAFHSASGEEAGKRPGVVASSVAMLFLNLWRPAKFRRQNDKSRFQQPPLFEVGNE